MTYAHILKKHRHKVIAGVVVLILIFAVVINVRSWLEAQKMAAERQKKEAQEQIFAQYPKPTIEILSSREHQGDAKEYTLEFTVADADRVSVNGKDLEVENPTYSQFSEEISLDETDTRIKIYAQNTFKNSSIVLTIQRSETSEEKEARLAREIELKRKRKEAEERAKKLAEQRAKINKRSYLSIEYEKGECLKFDSGKTVGCSTNSYCLLKTEWQKGGIHYFKGECQ